MQLTLITGATSGIGRSAALKLLQDPNNTVIVCCRDMRKTDVFEQYIQSGRCICLETDMSSQVSIENLITQLSLLQIKNIDNLILNAGIAGTRRQVEFEHELMNLCWVVNFVSNVYLMERITPFVKKDVKVIFVSSVTHHDAHYNSTNIVISQPEIPVEDLYAQTKLEIIKLANHLSMKYSDWKIIVVNPGYCDTGIWKQPRTFLDQIESYLRYYCALTSDEGAEILITAIQNDFPTISNEFFRVSYLSPYTEPWLLKYYGFHKTSDVLGRFWRTMSINRDFSPKIFA